MRVDLATLSSPVAQGIRLVALGLLEDAHGAAVRIATATDPDALHDFRVAVRRLRSWLRAFDDELGDAVRGKDRRRLRDLAHATNAARDIEVQLAWLGGAAKGFRVKRRRGADWLAQYLIARHPLADGQGNTALLASVDKVGHSLVERLAVFEQPLEAPHGGVTLARAIALRIAPHVDALGDELSNVHNVHDESEVHEARIDAKRLRYLTEPAVDSVAAGAELLARLKSLQDELGALHDAHVMIHELRRALELASTDAPDARDGLLALAERARADARGAFARARADWLNGQFATFATAATDFAERLAG